MAQFVAVIHTLKEHKKDKKYFSKQNLELAVKSATKIVWRGWIPKRYGYDDDPLGDCDDESFRDALTQLSEWTDIGPLIEIQDVLSPIRK